MVVHGAFAAAEDWWRPPAQASPPTFALQLEDALARRGLAGTVWQPALEAGLSVDDFAWSGDNTPAARRDGSAKLAESLTELARRSGATALAPLVVNAVGRHRRPARYACLSRASIFAISSAGALTRHSFRRISSSNRASTPNSPAHAAHPKRCRSTSTSSPAVSSRSR